MITSLEIPSFKEEGKLRDEVLEMTATINVIITCDFSKLEPGDFYYSCDLEAWNGD